MSLNGNNEDEVSIPSMNEQMSMNSKWIQTQMNDVSETKGDEGWLFECY